VPAERQLSLLGEIAAALGAAGIPFWLRGGWALDFLLGRILRDHRDIDLVAHLADRDAIHDVLTSSGFVCNRELGGALIQFKKHGESIQFALVERGSSGELVSRGFESSPWPDGALEGPVCELNGVRCRTFSPQALIEEKEGISELLGQPLRKKDHVSIGLLRELVAAYGSQGATSAPSSSTSEKPSRVS
jgi:hypothetical protein